MLIITATVYFTNRNYLYKIIYALTNIVFAYKKDFVTSIFQQTFTQFKEKINKFVDRIFNQSFTLSFIYSNPQTDLFRSIRTHQCG